LTNSIEYGTIRYNQERESMFDLFLINFGYVCGSYKTLDQAIKMGKKTGFQFSVYKNFPNKLVWSNV